MRPLRHLSVLVLLICMMVAVSSAQKERTPAASLAAPPDIRGDAAESGLSQPDFTLRADVSEVEVDFVALNPSGQPVSNLEAQDIKVVTDGRYSVAVRSFRALHSKPITLGIVIDLSESVRPEMHSQVVAFSDAVSQILRPAVDREFVVSFSNRVSLLQPMTSDFAQVKKTLERSRGDNNLTSLYDAIVRTCREQFDSTNNVAERQRILLVFTDGVDNLSVHTLDDAVEEAHERGVEIYAVAQEDGNSDGRQVLEELTARTGGALELLRKAQEPDLSVASLRGLIDGEYTISFRPPSAEPGFHPIELKSASERPLVLRARGGYYLDKCSK